MKRTIIILAATNMLLAMAPNFAGPQLYDRQTGKYLGNLSNNPYDANSTSNPYGRYGSEYSADSINNPYGRYGSRYSADSPNNPQATNPPVIIDGGMPGMMPEMPGAYR
jgi:hypothetical protein